MYCMFYDHNIINQASGSISTSYSNCSGIAVASMPSATAIIIPRVSIEEYFSSV